MVGPPAGMLDQRNVAESCFFSPRWRCVGERKCAKLCPTWFCLFVLKIFNGTVKLRCISKFSRTPWIHPGDFLLLLFVSFYDSSINYVSNYALSCGINMFFFGVCFHLENVKPFCNFHIIRTWLESFGG